MKNRVELKIAGERYAVIGDESEEYMQKIADLVNSKINEVQKYTKVSSLRTAVMASCNLADDYLRLQKDMENMRLQMNRYVKDSEKLQRELSNVRREVENLKRKK